MTVKVEAPHLHPIFVHFPQALFPVAFASLCIYLLTGVREFETGAFVAALFGALAGSAVLLRAFHPDLAVLPLGTLGWAYFALLAACTATCVVLGHYGGKLVFH